MPASGSSLPWLAKRQESKAVEELEEEEEFSCLMLQLLWAVGKGVDLSQCTLSLAFLITQYTTKQSTTTVVHYDIGGAACMLCMLYTLKNQSMLTYGFAYTKNGWARVRVIGRWVNRERRNRNKELVNLYKKLGITLHMWITLRWTHWTLHSTTSYTEVLSRLLPLDLERCSIYGDEINEEELSIGWHL